MCLKHGTRHMFEANGTCRRGTDLSDSDIFVLRRQVSLISSFKTNFSLFSRVSNGTSSSKTRSPCFKNTRRKAPALGTWNCKEVIVARNTWGGYFRDLDQIRQNYVPVCWRECRCQARQSRCSRTKRNPGRKKAQQSFQLSARLRGQEKVQLTKG